jgi:hypothetical protein
MTSVSSAGDTQGRQHSTSRCRFLTARAFSQLLLGTCRAKALSRRVIMPVINGRRSMTSKLVALGGATLALLMVSSLFDPADAHRRTGASGPTIRSGGGYQPSARPMGSGPRVAYSGGGPGYIHSGHRHRHPHRFHRHRFIVAAPLVYGAYYYGDGCYWLWRNAQETGSPYWWNRYYACLDGYGY